MVKPNKPGVIRNLEKTISRIVLDGLVWEKKVSRGSNCGLICLPKELVGKWVRFIMIPVKEGDSLSLERNIVDANAELRIHDSAMTKLRNNKERAEKQLIAEQKAKAEYAKEQLANANARMQKSIEENAQNNLEEEDAY